MFTKQKGRYIMTKKFKKILVGLVASAMCVTGSIGAITASAAQAYTLAPQVISGDWNPFTRDRSIVTIYGCNISSHATDQIYVHNLVLETKNDVGSTKNYSYSTSTFAQGQTQNNTAPFSKTQTSNWDDSYDLSARVNCTNSEIYCASCLDANNTTGYGTGDGPSPWISE